MYYFTACAYTGNAFLGLLSRGNVGYAVPALGMGARAVSNSLKIKIKRLALQFSSYSHINWISANYTH